jgi:3-oxoacyl-[acyl-carrier-protein] synthase-3
MVDRVVVDQANLRIGECLQQRTGIAPEKWLVNLEAIGNTAAASIVLALVDVLRGGVPEDGTRILLGAFGAGLTWCAGVLEWGVAAPGAVVMPRAEAATMVTRPLRLAG